MEVFKFGGASVKDAEGVKNVGKILGLFPDKELVVVVSAMGKTTNALERLCDAFFYKKENPASILQEIKNYHLGIVSALFPDKQDPIFNELHNTFVELEWAIEGDPEYGYDQEYDQMVSVGELAATKIVAAYLRHASLPAKWWDVRDFIQTDDTYREGKVDWEQTGSRIQHTLLPFFKQGKEKIVVLQGFIGVTSENFTTTLGRGRIRLYCCCHCSLCQCRECNHLERCARCTQCRPQMV